MSFDGPALSFDDEGSILFDGEKIIVTVPVGHEALDHLGSEKEIPFPVVYTHHSHHQDPQPATPPPPPGGDRPYQSPHDYADGPRSQSGGQGSSSDSDEQGRTGASKNRGQSSRVIDEIPDFAELGLMDTEPLPASAAPEWPGSRPLTVGQEMHVDHLLSTETNILVREVLIGIKREGMPSEGYVIDFISQFAEWTWDDLSGARALQMLENVRNSDRDAQLAQLESPQGGSVAQDMAGQDMRPDDSEQRFIEVYISGTLNVYVDETFIRGEDAPKMSYEVGDTARLFKVFGYSQSNADPFPKMLIEVGNTKVWFDPNDPKTKFADKPFDADQPELILQQENSLNLDSESLENQSQDKRKNLDEVYGVELDTQRPDGSIGHEGWSAEAVATVFEAVRGVADSLWTATRDRLAPYAAPQDRASLFRDLFGSLVVRLSSEAKPYYGITYGSDLHDVPGNRKNVIMFHKPGWENRGDWFKFNLEHEFGHVISNRTYAYPMTLVNELNERYDHVPAFHTRGWGDGSRISTEKLRESATPVVTRQYDPELTDPTNLVNEEWADMFLFWRYPERIGRTDDFDTIRHRFVETALVEIINVRYRIRMGPEELMGDDELPTVKARSDLYLVAEMRKDLEGVEGLDVTSINEDHSVVSGALHPGESTTILGISQEKPDWVLHMKEDGRIGWTHTDLLDWSGVDKDKLHSLPDNAIDVLYGLVED